jgi:hypothetical protein
MKYVKILFFCYCCMLRACGTSIQAFVNKLHTLQVVRPSLGAWPSNGCSRNIMIFSKHMTNPRPVSMNCIGNAIISDDKNLCFDQGQRRDISTSPVLGVPPTPPLPSIPPPESKQSSTPTKVAKSENRKLIAQPDFERIGKAIDSFASSPITFLAIFIITNICIGVEIECIVPRIKQNVDARRAEMKVNFEARKSLYKEWRAREGLSKDW